MRRAVTRPVSGHPRPANATVPIRQLGGTRIHRRPHRSSLTQTLPAVLRPGFAAARMAEVVGIFRLERREGVFVLSRALERRLITEWVWTWPSPPARCRLGALGLELGFLPGSRRKGDYAMKTLTNFRGENWLITPAALAANEPPPADIRDQKWLLTLTGVIDADLVGNSTHQWLHETLSFLPSPDPALNYAINHYSIPQPTA